MEEMWKRTDIFDEKFMTEWTGRPHAQKMWAHAAAYFEAKVKAIENFNAAGGKSNQYAAANTVTEMKDAVAAALDKFASQNRENAMAVNEVKYVREKIDTLQEAVGLLAKIIAGRETLTPRKRGRRNRCHHFVEESLDEESSSSEEEEEEPTPSPKPKRKAKKTQRLAKEKAKAKAKASDSFDVDGPYKAGMKFKPEWSQGKKAAYLAARKRYHRSGTKEAPMNKVS